MFEVTYVALWILVAALYFAVFLLYRHFGTMLVHGGHRRESSGPALEDHVSVRLQTVDGRSVEIGSDPNSHVVMFSAPGCRACEELLPKLRKALWDGTFQGRDLVLVHSGDLESAADYDESIADSMLVVSDPSRELARLWRVQFTPFFVSIGPGGVVRWKGASLEGLQSALASG